jgi:simple sugar transport system ATP-binding protein
MVGLRAEGISKRFGSLVANKDISQAFDGGEVHALLGENGAGKTTLMRIAAGFVRPDEGRIVVGGHPHTLRSPRMARDLGIGLVHQHFTLVPSLNVMENVVLGQSPRPVFLRFSAAEERIARILDTYGGFVDPAARVDGLSVGEQQRVEILKVLYQDPRIVLLDEPTALLSPFESGQLFRLMRRWAEEGRAVVFSTHRLREVRELADRITVLRKGRVVAKLEAREADEVSLTRLMVGHDLPRATRPAAQASPDRGRSLLSARGIVVADDARRPRVRDLSLDLFPGEIVGVAGVEGNGQRELAEALVGVRRPLRGRLSAFGRDLERCTAGELADLGIRYVPDDRRTAGLILDLSVLENLFLRPADRHHAQKGRMLWRRRLAPRANALLREYDVRGGDAQSPVRSLSGGNQQKVLLARELGANPRLLVAAQPTHGLDVAATDFVHRTIRTHRDRGACILYISSDLDEVLKVADRIVVLFQGSIVREMKSSEATRETVGRLMTGHDGAVWEPPHQTEQVEIT